MARIFWQFYPDLLCGGRASDNGFDPVDKVNRDRRNGIRAGIALAFWVAVLIAGVLVGK